MANMIWICREDSSGKRGDIETYSQFVSRNVYWWKENERAERTRRLKYYNEFIDYCKLNKLFSETQTVAEVGPGPFGGIIEVCKIPANQKFFIDYIMKELVGLKFIKWPDAIYIHAPVETIPLADNAVDILLSYNAIDHGWDIWAAIAECIRISRRCYLCFDCRGDSEKEMQLRRSINDLDHYQIIKFEDVEKFMERYKDYNYQVTDLGTKPEWKVATIVVEK